MAEAPEKNEKSGSTICVHAIPAKRQAMTIGGLLQVPRSWHPY
jgi:hypothetical protein